MLLAGRFEWAYYWHSVQIYDPITYPHKNNPKNKLLQALTQIFCSYRPNVAIKNQKIFRHFIKRIISFSQLSFCLHLAPIPPPVSKRARSTQPFATACAPYHLPLPLPSPHLASTAFPGPCLHHSQLSDTSSHPSKHKAIPSSKCNCILSPPPLPVPNPPSLSGTCAVQIP